MSQRTDGRGKTVTRATTYLAGMNRMMAVCPACGFVDPTLSTNCPKCGAVAELPAPRNRRERRAQAARKHLK